jgi:hypothetical protein
LSTVSARATPGRIEELEVEVFLAVTSERFALVV